MSKSVTASLPGALLVIFWWQRGKISIQRDVLPLVPFLIMGAVSGLFTAYVERAYIGAHGAEFDLSPVQRLLIAGRVPWFYLGKLFWPTHLIFIYERWDVDPKSLLQWLYPIALLALIAGLWKIRNRTRSPLAAVLFFIGSLFPVLGFVNVYPFIYSFVADHFQYLACLGIITLVAGGITVWLDGLKPQRRQMAQAASVVLVAVLGVMSMRQSRMYSDIETLYVETINRNPKCWMAYNNLAGLYVADEQLNLAKTFYLEALQHNPKMADSRLNLGVIYLREGELAAAIEQWNQAVADNPKLVDAYVNLALLYATTNDPEFRDPPRAVPLAQKAVEISEEKHASALAILGAAYAESGQVAHAIESAEKALKVAISDENEHLAETIKEHLKHYHELQSAASTKPTTMP